MAVFYSIRGEHLDIATVHLEADTEGGCAAEIASRGYTFAGTIAVIEGRPKVEIEPDLNAPAAMQYAGVLFASLLGSTIQKHQLQLQQAAAEVPA